MPRRLIPSQSVLPGFLPPRLLPWTFVLFALPLLLFLALAVPTGEVPDEVAHMIRMEGLLHRSFVGHRVPSRDLGGNPVADSGVTANSAMLTAGFSFVPGTPLAQRVMTRERAAALHNVPWNPKPTFVSITNTGVYSPLFYLPGAAAMEVAHGVGAGPWRAVLTARAVNAVLYVALGMVALLVARRAQGLMFAALVLPMSLWLAASCNQDGLVIASATLAAALLTRGTMRGWWTGGLVLAAVVMAKPLYLPLVGVLALLLPASALPRHGLALPLRLGGAVLAAVPALLWFGVAQKYAVVPFVRGEPFLGGPNWFGDPNQLFGSLDPGLQLQVLLHKPSLLVTLPFKTLMVDDWLLHGIVGVLGVLDILLPIWFYRLWFVAIGLLCVGEGLADRREARPGVVVGLLTVGCVVAAAFALFDGQYLSWTYTGNATIEGMQGRYFIPLIPFLGIALPFVPVGAAGPLQAALRLPAVVAAAAGMVIIPALVVGIYYLR